MHAVISPGEVGSLKFLEVHNDYLTGSELKPSHSMQVTSLPAGCMACDHPDLNFCGTVKGVP